MAGRQDAAAGLMHSTVDARAEACCGRLSWGASCAWCLRERPCWGIACTGAGGVGFRV